MKIFIVTGEKSGDIHASNLVREIKDVILQAWGGDRLIKEGVNVIKHINSIAFMGFWEVFKNIFTIKNNFKLCKSNIIDFNPDLIVLVDFAGFNLRIAEFPEGMRLKHLGIVGLLGGIGFTMSLFLIEMALSGNLAAIKTAKMAILSSSFASALLGCAFMKSLPEYHYKKK